MLTLPGSTLIFLARDRVDGRKGIDSLVALVPSQFGRDPLDGHLFVFLSRRADRARMLFWDRNGYALTLKRLEIGTFKPATIDASHAEIEYDELLALLAGLDMSAARRRPRWPAPRPGSVARPLNQCDWEFPARPARLRRAMAKSATATKPPIEQPSLDTRDASALRSFIEAMVALGAVAKLVSWLLALITRLWRAHDDLIDRLRSRKRRKGVNEALHRLQLNLPGLDWSAANDNAPPKQKRKPDEDKRKRGNNENRDEHGRASYPKEIPRVEEKQRVPDHLRRCARGDIELALKQWIPREILERIPARHFVRLILRERLQCPCCQAESVAAEPVDTLKDNSSLGVDLVADALVDHVGDAVPLERIARNAKAEGVPLSANTLGRNIGWMIDLCDPIVQHIFRRCATSHVVGADATSMPVLQPDLPHGIAHATLWNLLGDERWSYFGYAPNGEGDELVKLLNGCTLEVLQCGGASTLNGIAKVARHRGGCHSRARCKLVEALNSDDSRAIPALALYARLFAIEAESKALREDFDARLARRLVRSKPLIEELWTWVDEMRPRIEPRSPLGKALTYLTRQRATLEVFLADGRVAMTNNAVERELRTHVLNRKTWLFCGSEQSAKRMAAALTIVRTCKLHGVDPRAYLRFVVRRLLAGERDPTVLWPERFAAQQARQNAA